MIASALCVLIAGLAGALSAGRAHAQTQTLLTSDAQINSIACPATGACAAVGSYDSTGGEPLGLVLGQVAGVWSISNEAQLPAGASTDANVDLNSVVCPAAGSCTAVGEYTDNGYRQQGLMLNQRRGNWRPGVRLLPPGATAGNPDVTLSSVSCASAGNCTAVGSFEDTAGVPSALVLSETGWTWHLSQSVALPSGAASSGASSLASIACASLGNCTAVGWYTDINGAIQGLLVTESGGHWAAQAAVLPAAPATQPNVTLSSVACPAAGDCTAVGVFQDEGGDQAGLLLSQTGGIWSAVSEPTLPANAWSPQVSTLNAVACTGVGYCTAVGNYTDIAETFQGVVLTENAGSWGTGTEAVLPTNAAANQDATLNAVACVAYETCVVAGTYFSTHPTGLLLNELGGRWKLPLSAYMPVGSAGNPYTLLDAAACAPGEYCVAGGTYMDGFGNSQGVLMDGDGLYWQRGVEAPLPGGLVTLTRRRAAKTAPHSKKSRRALP